MQPHTEFRLPHGGLTLVELMVAMAIALLMAAVVASLYAAVLRASDARMRRLERAEPVQSALEALASDLAGAAAPWGATNPALTLAPCDDAGLELTLTTAEPIPGDSRGYALRAIRYRFTEAPPTVTRAAGDYPNGLHGSAPRTDVWERAGPVRVELLRGTEWTNAWGAQAGRELPRAARLSVGPFEPGRNPTAWSEVLIPAGHAIQRAP